MPEFLEKKLRAEYGNNPHAIYGTMNAIGAMHGNKETEKGKEMEKKHAMKIAHMHIEPAQGGGHVVEHHFKPKMKGGSGAFMEHSEPAKHVFGKGEGEQMLAHLKKHLGIGAAAAPKTDEGEMKPAAHEPPHESGAEEESDEGY
jgi:hypothetical protein